MKKSKEPEPINIIILAERFQSMLESGVVNNKSELAKCTGLSKAGITQTLNVLTLPQNIIEKLRGYSKSEEIEFFTERRLRPIINLKTKEAQYHAFNDLFNCIKTSPPPRPKDNLCY